MARRLAVFLGLLVLEMGGAGLSRAADPRPALHDYLEIVKAYRAGETSDALRSIARWQEKDVQDVTRELAGEEGPPIDAVTLAAASALHLDLIHGAGVSADTERVHLDALLRLLRKVRADALADESLAADLHLATVSFLQGQLLLTPLRKLVEPLEISFPRDARMALALGTLYETLASRRLAPGREAGLVPDAAKSLASAEAQMRRSLRLDPGLAEARLRMGRILEHRGEHDAALGEADGVLTAAKAPATTRYLAQLLRAAIFEGRRKLDEAVGALGAAQVECPCCSVPSLARSHLLFDQGKADTARASLTEALQPRECADPWVRYDFGQADQLAGLMASLRGRLR